MTFLPLLLLAASTAAADAPATAAPPPLATAPARAPDPAYLAELLAAARAKDLARDPQWLRLGHWRGGLLGAKSEADGPGFFLAPEGRRDPAAELDATIAGFFAPPLAEPEAPPGQPQRAEASHPQCRFPARLAFVAARLGLDATRLPLQPCPRFDAFWGRVRARSVTLVFSSYYLNNPASAFGHTFLRLNKAEAPGAGERLELLDQGVDYAAVVDTRNALVYAVKGLTGLFRGEFTARPYFYKVREYADYESRDLWEYDLDLAPAEVAMLVAHLWELGGTWFDYWYLTENCSWHILAALEAASPRLDLLSRVGAFTIPADTVKAVSAQPGLVRAVRWRPSIRTQFLARTAALDAPGLAAVEAVAHRAEAPLPAALDDAGRARVLDAAADLVDVRHGKEIVFARDAAVLRLRQDLLERRAAVPVVSPPLALAPPAFGGPDRGHDSSRLTIGLGASTADGPVVAIEQRYALHDLLDPPGGYSERAQIEFGRFRAHLLPRERKVRIQDATLVEVASLNALDRFDRRMSWRFRGGLEAVEDGGCRSCSAAFAEVGGGPGVLLGGSAVALLLTGDAVAHAAPDLDGTRGTGFRLGGGPRAALRLLGGDRLGLLAVASPRWFPWASRTFAFASSVEARLHLGPATIAATARRTERADEAVVSLQLFR